MVVPERPASCRHVGQSAADAVCEPSSDRSNGERHSESRANRITDVMDESLAGCFELSVE